MFSAAFATGIVYVVRAAPEVWPIVSMVMPYSDAMKRTAVATNVHSRLCVIVVDCRKVVTVIPANVIRVSTVSPEVVAACVSLRLLRLRNSSR